MTTQQKPAAPDYPLFRPEALSVPARVLYSQLGRRESRREAQACSSDYPELVAELTAAGLATVGWKGELVHTAVSDHYTRATGAGDVLAVVRQAYLDNPGHRGTLIAVVEGATTMWRTDRTVPELTIRANHASATDASHSPSHLFSADIALPQLLEARDATTLWGGAMNEMCAYDPGTDPLTIDDGDTRPGVCGRCATSHPFAPYLPPSITLGTVMVTVEIRPMPRPASR